MKITKEMKAAAIKEAVENYGKFLPEIMALVLSNGNVTMIEYPIDKEDIHIEKIYAGGDLYLNTDAGEASIEEIIDIEMLSDSEC